MFYCKSILTAALLTTLSALAQNASAPTPLQPNPQPAMVPTVQSAASTTTEGPKLPVAAQLAPPRTMDEVVDRAIAREHALMAFLKDRTPLVETYLQNLKPDKELGAVPSEDHYFLGRMDMGENVDRRDYLAKQASLESTLLGGVTRLFKFEYHPMGFSWMVYADRWDFDRQHYDFKYVRRDFLGDVRCIVFDVMPKKGTGRGRFQGRIWVEDQDYNIVRLNGTYSERSARSQFFHMDSWRLNLVPGYWVPSYIYSEEGDFSYGAKDKSAFKAQSRIWGYNVNRDEKEDELSQIKVDAVKDESSAAQDASPLEAQRAWQQQAEDNVIARLEQAGLLAPEGDVDKILATVINNLEVTNNIDLPRPVRARVMLTTPLETFSVGDTIIISRGLIDVLPDESSLAMVLSHELAHIVLGHNLGSRYAFNDRLLFSDESTYQNLGFRHNPDEEAAAEKKSLELLKNSPYNQKLDTAELFLKQLQARSGALSALLTPHLGNSFVDQNGKLVRFAELLQSGPALDINKLNQIAALPLGGRVKMNPWDDRVEMIKSAPVAIVSARDKMPLEVTPFFPHLARINATDNQSGATTADNTAPTPRN
jgi:hypothetical protein